MNAVTTHERPGVYSVYTASAAVSGTARRGTAAIAARSDGGTEGTVYSITSYRQAAEAFGESDGLTELVRLLLASGVTRVTDPGDMSRQLPGEAHDGDFPLRRYLRTCTLGLPQTGGSR